MSFQSRTLGPRFAETAVVYVVEDDADLREGIGWTLRGAGYRDVGCESGRHALDVITPRSSGCVLIDLHLPDMHGLELRKRLLQQRCRHPFIVLTGCGDVSLAVQSLHDGAVDFLQKPYNRNRLLERVGEAVQSDQRRNAIQNRINSLTSRERDVLRLVIDGQATKEIASRFGISPRTVDVHRHHILRKMGIQSFVQLMRVLNDGSQFETCLPDGDAEPPESA